MKFLKKTLGDGKEYIFTTFSVLETVHLKKHHDKWQSAEDEKDAIMFETNEKGKIKKDDFGKWIEREDITSQQKQRIEAIDKEAFDFATDIVLKSICKKHPEFKKSTDSNPEIAKTKDEETKNRLLDMLDASDLKSITSFAFTGTYTKEISMFTDIPLEVKAEDVVE